MTRRRKLFQYERTIVFLAANGLCHICREPITERLWHCDHVFPFWKGGTDAYENMRPAHVNCHSRKTRRESWERAKIPHNGKPKKPSRSRAIPGAKRSGFRVRLTRAGPKTERR